RTGTTSAADVGRRAVTVSGQQLRRAVALSTKPGFRCPRYATVPGFRRQFAASDATRNGVVLREYSARRPQRAGFDQGGLHVSQRSARETLWNSTRLWQSVSTRGVGTGQPSRRSSAARQYPDDYFLCHSYIA